MMIPGPHPASVLQAGATILEKRLAANSQDAAAMVHLAQVKLAFKDTNVR